MKILVTGALGFVGKHFCSSAESKEDFFYAAHRKTSIPPKLPNENIQYIQCELETSKSIVEVLKRCRPDAIVHLASASSVAYSWKNPAASFLNNIQIFINLVEAIRLEAPKVRLLSVGSSEQYGYVSKKEIPLVETMRGQPTNPYAVARQAQENLSLVYAQGLGLDIICTRSFNHIGAGQDARFVVPALINQALQVKRGASKKIEIGNAGVVRDFIDIRDVISAYSLLLQEGKSGEVYNVCSGVGHSIKQLANMIQEILNIDCPVIESNQLLRPTDNPLIVGSSKKLGRMGWSTKHNLYSSLEYIISQQQLVEGE